MTLAGVEGAGAGEEEEGEAEAAAATERARREIVEEVEAFFDARSSSKEKLPTTVFLARRAVARGGRAMAWAQDETRTAPQSACARVEGREARIECDR